MARLFRTVSLVLALTDTYPSATLRDMKTTANEISALRKLDSDKFREVSAELVAALAAKGLCTALGNITDAGVGAAGLRYSAFNGKRGRHILSAKDQARAVSGT